MEVDSYLAQRISATSGEEAETWARLQELHGKKLWHQLTIELLNFVTQPCFENGGLKELYDNFIHSFQTSIKPLSLVKLALVVTTQIPEPLPFLEELANKVTADSDASVCVKTAIAEIHLRSGNMTAAKESLDACNKVLDGVTGVTPMHSALYRVSAEYHKTQGNFAEFYGDALRYLGCVELDDLAVEDKVQRAFDLGLAALLGKDVYNFGELLAHNILDSLKETEKSWLIDLLYAFNSGDVAKYESLRAGWSAQEDLRNGEQAIRQKLSLLCVMELVFESPSQSAGLSFECIAEKAQIPLSEVELLLMKALSFELVKGKIDQVKKVAQLTWVQPRVLDLTQLGKMKTNLEQWAERVQKVAESMDAQTVDIKVD